KVDTLVVDKTGTLTEGKPRLVTVEAAAPGVDEATLLRLASGLERSSEHPLADAIVKGARARGVEPTDVEGFQSVIGKGVRGRAGGHDVSLGNRAMMADLGVDTTALDERSETLRADGQTVMFL